jgi:hypothetical protein
LGVAIQLYFKNPICESNGALALSAIIGGTNSGKVFLSTGTQVSRQEDLEPVKNDR